MKYFTIEELTKSATAKRLGIDNTPNREIQTNLKALVDNVLDPLRQRFGAPIIVTSGYRCDRLNKVVGGATNSQHCKGMAADIRTVSDNRADNMRLLRCLIASDLKFDQLICEYPDSSGRPDWIHVSFNLKGNRGSKLTAKKVNGITTYTTGIKV